MDPGSGLGAGEDGLADTLGFEGIAEGWAAGFAGFEALEEISDLVDEAMFVADLEAGDPPILHVGLVAIGDVDASPASDDTFIAMIEVAESMEVVEIPSHGSMFTVDFEGVEGFVAASVASGFEGGEGAIGEACQEGGGVVDADRFFASGFGVHAFFDEGFGHGGHAFDAAVKPDRRVDAMGEQVAGHAAAGGIGIESPGGGSTLGDIFGDGPILEEEGAVVEDASEFPAIDDLFGQGYGGDAAIVVPDGVGDAGAFDGLDHADTFFDIHGEGFFAEDHFAGFGGGQRDFAVEVIRGADVDGIDILAGDELSPVGFDRLVAPLVGEGLGFFGIACADGLEDRLVFEIEKVVDFGVAIGVSAAHESVANHADAKRFLCHVEGHFLERETMCRAAEWVERRIDGKN